MVPRGNENKRGLKVCLVSKCCSNFLCRSCQEHPVRTGISVPDVAPPTSIPRVHIGVERGYHICNIERIYVVRAESWGASREGENFDVKRDMTVVIDLEKRQYGYSFLYVCVCVGGGGVVFIDQLVYISVLVPPFSPTFPLPMGVYGRGEGHGWKV